jgi:transcription initiation factor IIE alpha subunit
MLPDKNQLSELEQLVVEIVLLPYGVEMTSSDVLLKSKTKINSSEVVSILDGLVRKGYLKVRDVTLPDYLVKRRVYAINHKRLYNEASSRYHTRVIIDMMVRNKVPVY